MGDYIGMDLHKTKSFVTRMTAQGHILEPVNLLHITGALPQYRTALPADATWRAKRRGTGCGCTSRSKTASSIWGWPIP